MQWVQDAWGNAVSVPMDDLEELALEVAALQPDDSIEIIPELSVVADMVRSVAHRGHAVHDALLLLRHLQECNSSQSETKGGESSPQQGLCLQESVDNEGIVTSLRVADIHVLGSPEATEVGQPLPALHLQGTSAPPGSSQVWLCFRTD